MNTSIDLESWGRGTTGNSIPEADSYELHVSDGGAFNEKKAISDPKPIGRQVLETFNRIPADEYVLLNLQRDGNLEEIGLSEVIDLRSKGAERLYAFRSDRTYSFVLNGRRFPWGDRYISAETLRFLGQVPEEHQLLLDQEDQADRIITSSSPVDLGGVKVERIHSRKEEWQLNVQGVIINFPTSEVLVSDALLLAGIDPSKDWMAILKVSGEPKRTVALSDYIDLSKPGIEKLRFRPNEINNGEAPLGFRRDFRLLKKDEEFLNNRGFHWETVIEDGRRWLIIRSYPLPSGYQISSADIASDIPQSYPAAEIDMFYCYPPILTLANVEPPTTTVRVQIENKQYQRWSRHLNGATKWDINSDSVISHIGVIDECLAREVEV